MQNISASALTDYSPVQRGQKRNHQLEIGKNNTAFVNTCCMQQIIKAQIQF